MRCSPSSTTAAHEYRKRSTCAPKLSGSKPELRAPDRQGPQGTHLPALAGNVVAAEEAARTAATGTDRADVRQPLRRAAQRFGRPVQACRLREGRSETTPTLRPKHVTPHSFRHATAVHLISAGVDVTVIRSWLGHVSLDTTNHYARANLETKRKALEQVAVPATPGGQPSWKRDASVLAWLDTL